MNIFILKVYLLCVVLMGERKVSDREENSASIGESILGTIKGNIRKMQT